MPQAPSWPRVLLALLLPPPLGKVESVGLIWIFQNAHADLIQPKKPLLRILRDVPSGHVNAPAPCVLASVASDTANLAPRFPWLGTAEGDENAAHQVISQLFEICHPPSALGRGSQNSREVLSTAEIIEWPSTSRLLLSIPRWPSCRSARRTRPSLGSFSRWRNSARPPRTTE